MDLRQRFERRVSEPMVAQVLESIAKTPSRRSRRAASDLDGDFDFWFDGGAAKIETGYVEYQFLDGTKAVVANPVPALSAITSHFWKSVDTVVMGRKTYEAAARHGMTSYPGVDNYVFSRTLLKSPDPKVQLISDDAAGVVRAFKKENGKGSA